MMHPAVRTVVANTASQGFYYLVPRGIRLISSAARKKPNVKKPQKAATAKPAPIATAIPKISFVPKQGSILAKANAINGTRYSVKPVDVKLLPQPYSHAAYTARKLNRSEIHLDGFKNPPGMFHFEIGPMSTTLTKIENPEVQTGVLAEVANYNPAWARHRPPGIPHEDWPEIAVATDEMRFRYQRYREPPRKGPRFIPRKDYKAQQALKGKKVASKAPGTGETSKSVANLTPEQASKNLPSKASKSTIATPAASESATKSAVTQGTVTQPCEGASCIEIKVTVTLPLKSLDAVRGKI